MSKIERRRRVATAFILMLLALGGALYTSYQKPADVPDNNATIAESDAPKVASSPAISALGKLAVKGRAPKTGYTREQFGGEWSSEGSCNMRDKVLARDMTNTAFRSAHDCDVLSGTLNDPYTGKTIQFTRGASTSSKVQIDHVVAISNAWQTGAQQISPELRRQLYNDPLELLAVDGPANNQKGDGDAATWLPPNKAYRCRYVARQIAVKLKYHLWVTPAEHDAIARILGTCPDQKLPVQK
jgi:hypothetical protein